MMTNRKLYIFCALLSVLFYSCSKDESSEKIPSNEIRGSYDPQLNYLNKAIENDSEDDELLFKRAGIYFNMYRNDQALNDIKLAIKENDTKPDYYLLLAQLYFASNKYFETIKSCEKAEGLGLNNPELYVLQSRVYWAVGDTIGSKRYLSKAEQLVPFHSDLKLLKGEQAAYKGDSTLALTYFLESIKSDRKNTTTYRKLIELYLNRAKYDSALFYTIQAKVIDPRNPTYYYAEGKIFEYKDLIQSAIVSYENCIKEDSSYSLAYYQLGQLYYDTKEYTLAKNYLDRYISFNNQNIRVYLNLISINQIQGTEELAIPYLERLVQLDTNNIAYKVNLQRSYKKWSHRNLSVKETDTKVEPRSTPVTVERVDMVNKKAIVPKQKKVEPKDSTISIPVKKEVQPKPIESTDSTRY